MNKEDLRLCGLPNQRTGLRVEWLSSWPMWGIGAIGLALYVLTAFIISGLEWWSSLTGDAWVKATDGSFVGWWDIVYFNFVSIMTIGYGDYVPLGGGARILTVFEALLGTGILGITLAALTAKFLSSPGNAVVFSRHAYYCTQDEKFLVIYLNTTRSRLVNAELSSFFKLGGDWAVRPSVRSPFVTRAVQTFFTNTVPEDEIVKLLNDASDAFRFAISGQIGSAFCSAAIKYKPNDIIVLPNRDALTVYPGFWDPDLQSREFQSMFHYRPANALTLSEYVKVKRQQGSPDSR
jgi:hypothetical protein